MASEIMAMEQREIDGLRSESSTAIERAKAIAREIKDALSLDSAARMMLEAKSRIKVIAARFSEPKRNARAAWQGWIDLEMELTEPYRRIELDILKPAMVRFTEEQDRKRRIEEDRLRVEAKKREEEERLAAAIEHEKRGDREAAEVVINNVVPVAPVVVPKMEQPKGISYKDIWRYRIVDESKIPREYLRVDEPKIGGVVRSLKSDARIPGVEVFSEKVIAGRV